MTTLPDLPVTEALPRLHAALDAGRNAVLVAPPGAGKTTLVPLALLDAPWRGDQRILMLEPRRLATRAAATRMASLRGEAVGGTIGFRTRLEGAGSAATRVEVVTEGLLVRRLQSDPGLDGIAAVILDEVHERSLESDLALALCLDLQRMLRPELRLLAMSATADGARLSGLMDAEVVESAGRMFPVTVQHAARDIATARDLPDAMARAIRAALAEHAGDILAFLPGMAEIRRTQAALDRCGALVLPLHGELPPADQDRALRPAEGRRVVLATSIAETSLTVPGVRIVVDGGFRRAPRLDQATGLTRLATLRISRAAAEQRAGRAGREAPGVAIRLWTQALHRGMPPFDRPEILEAELSGLALDCAAWGTPPADLPFQDRPPAGALAAAGALLRELGALDQAGRITADGRRMAQLGAHPRLAAMLLAADGAAEQAMAADLAALLEERDPLRSPEAPCDIALRLAAIAHGDPEADRAALARIRRAADQYRRRIGRERSTARPTSSPLPLREGARGRGTPTPEEPPERSPHIPDPGRLLAAAFPDRIAQRRGEPGSFRLSGGGGAKLPRLDPLANAPLLVIAALEMKASARIRLAAPLDAEALPPALEARVTEQVEGGLDPATGSVLARRRRRLGALILSDRTEPADPEAIAQALASAAAGDLRTLPWTDAARQLQARVAWMRQADPDGGWPDLSDASLAATAADWLAPHLLGYVKLADLQRLDLLALLRGALPWPLPATLDQALPTHLSLPGGRAAIDYTQPVPQAEARAQAFYGVTETPRLAGGRVPLRLALLSPAGRPVAVTADLAQFWTGGWADVRRDMRGRYPKHRWPENPARPEEG
ncbi:MAG: ATP-dependent helicase HrpB [Rhodospirillales bacterium]|nr:ATP-dependent helicase HrpB [Rhodospirillales bacterium]